MSKRYTSDKTLSIHESHPGGLFRRGLQASARLQPIGAMLFTMAVGGCHSAPPPAVAPAAVLAFTAHAAGGVDAALRYPVEAAARYSNNLSFRVAGKLIDRQARLGDRVRSGQVLARLDAEDASKQSAAADAALEAAEHRLTFARQQLERDRAQFEQKLIAASAFEQTTDAAAAAKAAREQAAAQASVAHNALAYHTLTADHDGVITAENADTGQFVSAGQTVYGLAWSGDVDALLDAPARDIANMTIGRRARVEFAGLPQALEAAVREIAPAADPGSRTYRVKLALKPGGGTATPVLLGMSGEAVIETGPPTDRSLPAFSIPATAIFHREADPAVWVIRPDSTLELRAVRVSRYTDATAVVTHGLADGERLVGAGVHTVFAGERVTVAPPLAAEAAPASIATANTATASNAP